MEDNFDYKNDEILKSISKYLEDAKKQNQDRYKINRPQWTKMVEIIEYLTEAFPATDKSLEPFTITPSIGTGGASISFCVASLDDPSEIMDFTNALMLANRVVFFAETTDSVCMEILVYKVFIPKDEEEREVL